MLDRHAVPHSVAALLAVLIAAAGLASCGSAGKPAAREVIIPVSEDPQGLNPYNAQTDATQFITRVIYEGLDDLNPDGSVAPILASRLPTVANGDVSQDLRSVTWHLRPGVAWSDGSPFTSADVAFTLRVLIDSDDRGGAPSVANIETPNRLTIRLIYAAPYPAYLQEFSGTGSDGSVQGILSGKNCRIPGNGQQLATRLPCERRPVGTGPYELAAWSPDAFVRLQANPHYRIKGEPQVPTLYFPVVPAEAGRERLVHDNGNAVLPFFDFQHSSAGATLTAGGAWLMRIDVNTARPGGNPALRDVRVRRAIDAVLEARLIERTVLDGKGQVANNELFAPGPFHCDSAVPDPSASKSRQLLKDAGFVPPVPGALVVDPSTHRKLVLRLYVNSDPPAYPNVAAVVAQELRSIGIGTTITQPQDMDSLLLHGNFDLALRDDGFRGDPGEYLTRTYASYSKPDSKNATWDAGWNIAGFRSAALDKLLTEASTETNEARRRTLLCSADKLIVTEAPVIHLGTFPYPDAFGKSVQGWQFNPYNTITWDAARWSLR